MNNPNELITEIRELVKFLKENKIFTYKKGDLEITFSQLAFVQDHPEPKKDEEKQGLSPQEEEVKKLKTLIDESKISSRDETQLGENNKKPNDPLLGGYEEGELFR